MTNTSAEEYIAFYNVENLFTPDPTPKHKADPTPSGLNNWDQRKYQNKLFKIAHVFELMQQDLGQLPMLIGVAEIQGRKPLEDLIALPPLAEHYKIIHYESMDERGVDVALLYDSSKVELLSSQPLSYFFTVEETNYEYFDTTRDVLFCKIKFQNQIINVFVLHLPSKREKDINKSKRDFILSDLNKKIKNLISNDKQSAIVLGDFNDNPDEENITNFLYDDDFNKILVNPSLNLFKTNNFSTYHYKNGLLFDQVILSEDLLTAQSKLRFKYAQVFNHQKLRNWDQKFSDRPFRTFSGSRYLGGYSDHFPVIAIFEKSVLH